MDFLLSFRWWRGGMTDTPQPPPNVFRFLTSLNEPVVTADNKRFLVK